MPNDNGKEDQIWPKSVQLLVINKRRQKSLKIYIYIKPNIGSRLMNAETEIYIE